MEDKFELIEKWGQYADHIYYEVLTNDWDLNDWSTKNEYDEYEENSYIPDDKDFIELVKISLEIKEKIVNKELKMYNGLIELSDNHTLWQIENDIEQGSEDGVQAYSFELAKLMFRFDKETGTNATLEGRSGRHVCVENTIRNAYRYEELCELQQKLEKELIERFS